MENSYEDSSDPLLAESQPTQLLENVLGVGGGGGRIEPLHSARDHEHPTNTVEEPNITTNTFDSSSSSVRHPVSRYHFHGLAATQSQHEECTDNEGSQKENTPTSAELHGSPGTNFRACSPRPSSKFPPKLPHVDLIGQPFGNKGPVALTTARPLFSPPLKSKASKAVSFQSSRPAIVSVSPTKAVQSSKTMPMRSNHYYRRSPSQDSFGGPVSQDPEKQFFESAKQFEVPLSELGLPSNDETPSSPGAEPVEEEQDFFRLMKSAYNDEQRRRSAEFYDTSEHGKVLVAATPSNSGSSQSQEDESFSGRQSDSVYAEYPNNLVETQPSTQLFEDSSEPSSSYERLLAGEPSQEPTQIDELQPTQVDESGTDDLADTSGDATQLQLPTPEDRSSVPSVGARSLVSLVDPNKRLRYAKYATAAPKVSRPEQPDAERPTRDDLISDTQPSNVFTDSSAVLASSEPGPSRGFGHLRRNVPASRPRSPPPHSDAMDIVPDSEPPRAGPNPMTPTGPTFPPARMPENSGRHMRNKGYPPSPSAVSESMVVEEETKADLSEEEEDIPLAATRALKISQPSKGKGKMTPAHRPNADKTINNARRTGATGRSWDTGIVPSSVPDQDALKTNSAAAPVLGRLLQAGPKGRGSKPPSVASDRKTRSASTTSDASSKRRRISSDTEEDDELRLKARDLVAIPKALREEEEETEPADEDDMDVDTPDEDLEPGLSTRKRKRGPKSKRVKNVSRASVKPNARATPTLASRPNKRLRSVTSSSRTIGEPATNVYALWKQDSYYYSGTVYSHSVSTKYLVKFDDNTEDIVDISKMRLREPMVGDEVILVEDGRRAKVKQVQEGPKGVLVEVDDGDDQEEFDVNVQDFRIAGRTILRQWQNRMLEVETIVPVLKPKSLKSTPSPSKGSLLGNTSTKGGRSKILNRTGLVITLSPNNENWEKEKDRVMHAIKNNGGTVIEDWSHVISMEGKHSNGNKRWVAGADEFQWIGPESLQRVFLLADDANQKPKFLMALALGVPCLSFSWLHDTVEKGVKDWQPYLLPAGFCDSLYARVSQLVDLEWGNCTENLSDIMSNPVASKLFAKKSVLCYGAEFIPLPKKKSVSDADKTKEASRAVPSIILAMGAKRVEAVSDIKFASDQSLNTFDYVVIKDLDDIARELANANDKLVHVPWVKECLMAGRLLSRS